MQMKPYTNDIEGYLAADGVVDYGAESITRLAENLYKDAGTEIEYIRRAYEYVRNHISHSAI